MPRFVIQKHSQKENIHYDFMLESGDILKTWRIPQSPDNNPQNMEQIQDHRKLYLEYEGELSGGRGSVMIWDKGEYSIHAWTDSLIEIELFGIKLNGKFQLSLTQSKLWLYQKVSI